MRPLVEEVVAEITASTCPDCNVMIGDLPDAFADENMVRQVLANLIGNACKFAPQGAKPQVEIGGHVEGDEAVFFVRDQGVGFDMRFADKLFKVFERLHTAADGYAGHGVGLAIVARAIRRHGGRVWAQGAEGRGATFWFTLPRADDGEAAVESHGRQS
jgi:signal transduction histidine kinase